MREELLPIGAFGRLCRVEYAEGPSAQVLHLGPFRDEKPTVDKLIAFIAGGRTT